MSGHSKWSTIKRKKGATDAKKAKVFAKLAREIGIAVRAGGPEADMNPRLRMILLKCRSANMPADNIDRAIKRASGDDDDAGLDFRRPDAGDDRFDSRQEQPPDAGQQRQHQEQRGATRGAPPGRPRSSRTL